MSVALTKRAKKAANSLNILRALAVCGVRKESCLVAWRPPSLLSTQDRGEELHTGAGEGLEKQEAWDPLL